ncbi:MAG: amino acid adenylation domain-containing protein, partial [Acidobacteriota bacterium]
PIATLDVAAPAEQARLAAWSGLDAAIDPDTHAAARRTTLVAAIAEVTARTPDAPAVIDGATTLSYASLTREARRLAHHLRVDVGVARGEIVAVAARRTAETLIALLGVLEAGAVYLPIDPTLPPARRRMLLDDSRCGLLLVGAADAADAGALAAGARAVPRTIAGLLGDARDDSPSPLDLRILDERALDGDEPAYVIYTSGSTGRPKGVVVRHDGVVGTCRHQAAVFGVTADDRMLQFASASFDASLAEIFIAWLSGAAVVVIPRAVIDAPARFVDHLRQHAVTAAILPPAYLRALDGAALETLRVLVTAGEAAQIDDVRRYGRDRVYVNAYGPTETSICASVGRVDPAALGDGDAWLGAPIGRPIAGNAVVVVDAALRPTPIGVPGELCVVGPSLALGYLGRPAATAAAFVPSPWGDGLRLYRTGDRARWRDDGTLAFEGRVDDQVKIAGHRVELDAVTRALRALDAVDDAVVLAAAVATGDDGDAGRRELAAYYVPQRPEATGVALWPSVAEFFVYDDVLYGSMAGDTHRNDRYREAFGRHVAGKRVVEIGPGAELVLTRLALEAGATHVTAIELLPATYARAQAKIAQLGLEDRITLRLGDARTIALDEPADVCISEIVGSIGGSEGAAPIINAARRLVKDPAAMLPQRSVTRCAAIGLDDADDAFFTLEPIAAHYVARIFAQVGRSFDLRMCLKGVTRDDLLSTDGVFEDLDYTREIPYAAEHAVELTMTRAGALSGLLVWLTLDVDDQAHLDTLGEDASWLPIYLPLFDAPVAVAPGDALALTITRRLADDGLHPDFHLRGALRRSDGAVAAQVDRAAPHAATTFRGDAFYQRLFADGDAPRVRRAEGPAPETLRAALASTLAPYELPTRWIALDRLPLNASGKVDRRMLPAPRPAPAAAAPTAAADVPVDAHERHIAAAWQSVLGAPVGPTDSFFALGGDSLKAIRIVAQLHEIGLQLEVRDIFALRTVRACAARIRAAAPIAQETLDGPLPITPIQRWFFDRVALATRDDRVRAAHYNQSVLLRSRARLDRAALHAALEAVITHHDALRSVVAFDAGGAPAVVMQPAPQPLRLDEITCVDAEAWHDQADAIQADADLTGGPLMRAAWVHLPDEDVVWLIAHHLVIDVVSWGIVIDDVRAAYRAAAAGEAIALPRKTHAVRDYAAALNALAATWATDAAARDAIAARWQAIAPAVETSSFPPRAAGDDVDDAARIGHVALRLDAARTARLRDALGGRTGDAVDGGAGEDEGPQIADAVLVALGLALRTVSDIRRAGLTFEGHGRVLPVDGLDVSRTVGWFTTVRPFTLALDDGCALDDPSTLRAALAQMRDQRRAIAGGDDVAYAALTYLATPAADRPAPPEIGFNDLGVLDGTAARDPDDGGEILRVDWNAPGAAHSPALPPAHALDVLSAVVDDALEVDLNHDRRRVDDATAVALRDALARALDALVDLPQTTDDASAEPAFTYAGLTGGQLDAIVAGLAFDDE